MKKLFEFRKNKTYKKILTIIFFLIIIFLSLNNVPDIKANIYDLVIHKISITLKNLSYISPLIFLLNWNLDNIKHQLKNKQWWSNVLGFIVVFIIILISSNTINLLHSKDYHQRYKEYNATKIIYQNNTNDDEEEQTPPEKENEENVITDNNDEKNPLPENKNPSLENQNKPSQENQNKPSQENQNIKIHFIDVGQGDSTFIELPNNTNMLIDAGESSKGEIVSNYIKALGYSKITYLIGTHPHSDHIGGLPYIINNFTIENIYMPKALTVTAAYENLLSTIYNKNLKVKNAQSGTKILNDNNLYIDVIAPNNNVYTDLNNYSLVIKITYKNRKFLFMGDAETPSEEEIKVDVSADVIKIGHHGSTTSSSENFINRVKPKYAIIPVGKDNNYNHPHQTVIDRLKAANVKIYRTDQNGNIVVTSDGNSIEIKTSK